MPAMANERDVYWMNQALTLAREAAHQGEIPVGAVLVRDEQLIASAYNQPISMLDPSAHAEMVVMRAGAQAIGNYRLSNTTLYVTLEPCAMCAGAMVHARIQRLVYGALDPKAGVVVSQLKLLDEPFFNHHVDYEGGVMAEACGRLLGEFFQSRR